jgi:hypothetical protein
MCTLNLRKTNSKIAFYWNNDRYCGILNTQYFFRCDHFVNKDRCLSVNAMIFNTVDKWLLVLWLQRQFNTQVVMSDKTLKSPFFYKLNLISNNVINIKLNVHWGYDIFELTSIWTFQNNLLWKNTKYYN